MKQLIPMISKTRTTVSLESDLSLFVDGLVDNNLYPSKSSAINEGVRLLKRSEEAKARTSPDAQIARALKMKTRVRRVA